MANRVNADPALYRIAVASQMTGVPEHTLRVWDRRYGSLASHRTEAGYRLYTSEDLNRIRRLRELVDAGHAIGDIAKLSLKNLIKLGKSISTPARADGPLIASETRRRFLAAVDIFDLIEAARLMAAARIAFSPFELVSEVMAPLLAELGQRWADNREDAIAQEHAATLVLRDELMRLLFSAQRSGNGPRLVVAAPEAELHEFGALIAAVVAAHAGANVLYLGPNLPAHDLARAAVKDDADIVLLSLVCLPEKSARKYCRLLRAEVDSETKIFVGGGAAKGVKTTGVEYIDSLDQLRTKIRDAR